MPENPVKVLHAQTVDEAVLKAVNDSDMVSLAIAARHIKELGESVHFKKYFEICIAPLLEKKIKALRNEKDPGECRYLQGFLDGIDEVLDTKSFEKSYRLKIEKNAQTRTNRTGKNNR